MVLFLPGVYHPVVVNVDGKGDALLQMQSQKKRSFALTPLITRISPNMGSLAGGTKITIQVGYPVAKIA